MVVWFVYIALEIQGRTVLAESPSLDRVTPHKSGSKNPAASAKIGLSIQFRFFQSCWSVNLFRVAIFRSGERAEKVKKDPSHSVASPTKPKKIPDKCRVFSTHTTSILTDSPAKLLSS